MSSKESLWQSLPVEVARLLLNCVIAFSFGFGKRKNVIVVPGLSVDLVPVPEAQQ